MAALNAMLDNPVNSQSCRCEVIFAVCMAALRSLPKDDDMLAVRTKLISSLKGFWGKSIRAALAVAMFGNELSERLLGLCLAFTQAERAYLKRRDDVALAIEKGEFICALHHYCLHGATDKMQWPEQMMFSQLIRNSTCYYNLFIKIHLKLFNYTNVKLGEAMFQAISLKIHNMNVNK